MSCACPRMQIGCLGLVIVFWAGSHFSMISPHLPNQDLPLLHTGGAAFLEVAASVSPVRPGIPAGGLEAADPGKAAAAGASAAAEKEEEPPLAGTAANLHTVYQLGCSAYSLHGAIALDWSWQAVKQPGRLTRIVCGCNTDKDREMLRVSPLQGDPRFAVFFSKDWNTWVPSVFPEVRDDKYHAYNHPFGLLDWLDKNTLVEEYVAYMEPDMVFNKPMMFHVEGGDQVAQVTRGNPVGQNYPYVRALCPDPCQAADPGWAEFTMPEVCGEDCPAAISATADEASYAVGPPTIMHREDWKRLAPRWGNYSVTVRAHGRIKSDGHAYIPKGGKVYIAEMLGYSLAAATLGLAHQVIGDLAVDAMSRCSYPFKGAGCHEARMLHYCYPQNVKTPFGHWIWNKYRMPVSYATTGEEQWKKPLFLDCDMPLLAEPPDTVDDPAWKGADRDRHVFWMIQRIVWAYNGGFESVKAKRCLPNLLEKKRVLKVTEQSWYVPADSLPGGPTDLASRLRYKIV